MTKYKYSRKFLANLVRNWTPHYGLDQLEKDILAKEETKNTPPEPKKKIEKIDDLSLVKWSINTERERLTQLGAKIINVVNKLNEMVDVINSMNK